MALPPHRSVSVPFDGVQAPQRPTVRTIERKPEEPLRVAYRKLLRWYPREWRAENEEAMLGILLDVADHVGRTRPTRTDARGARTRDPRIKSPMLYQLS